MESALYVSLSAQAARMRRLETIASNIANSQTVGFRGTQVRFEELVQKSAEGDVSYSSQGVEYLDETQGGLDSTGNPLDFAVRGDAWFGVQTPAGIAMTRDGRFTMSPEGQLQSLAGNPVLDPGGAPIQLNPAGGPPELGADGFIRQGGNQVGAIGLFSFDAQPGFQRAGGSGILINGDPQPIVDSPDVGIVQGHVEQSNIDPLREITQLIQLQRTFEEAASLQETSEQSLDKTIQALDSRA